ncbi:MAG TPA: hypothetical protein VLE97_00785 [Gaiellaceae bacterium]|nr:hypothetical protein [Gaiellaceae bacterium]
MKLKILLLALFAAGLSASLAFAEDGKPKDTGPKCVPVNIEGTMAPQSLTMTVTHSGGDGTGTVANGPLTLTVGTTGQTVRVHVEACLTGTALTVKNVQLQPLKPKPPGTTTGDEHHGDKPHSTTTTSGDGDHKGTTTTSGDGEHHGTTTTSPTTTTTP